MIESTLVVGDTVRIECAGITVIGKVKSSYDQDVWLGAAPFQYNDSVHIANQPEGIEVIDMYTDNYHYWKSVDGNGKGIVYKLHGEEETQLFPRLDQRGWTVLELRLAKSIFKRYVKNEVGKTGRGDDWDRKQLGYILALVKTWFVKGGLFHEIGYNYGMAVARELDGTGWDRTYVQDIRSAYNNCIRSGQANL